MPIRDLTGRLVSFDHQGQTPFLCHHHAPITTPLHLSDTTFQCMWLQPPLLSPEQAFSLSIHRMKATLLAAAGQLDLNRDKVTAKKQKKAFHSMQEMTYGRWPSFFLQRDILFKISEGWRPLTKQQPLPEPTVVSPPVTQADLQCLQLWLPKHLPKEGSSAMTSMDELLASDDSDQQGQTPQRKDTAQVPTMKLRSSC